MTESWEEKTERMEREYQARIDRLREELRDMEEQKLHVESRFEERVRQHEQIEYTNAALKKRVAELEVSVETNKHWFAHAWNCRDRIQVLERLTDHLQSQLEAKDKRVTELERIVIDLNPEVNLLALYDMGVKEQLKTEALNRELLEEIEELKSQLAWTPVSAGLPTEPGVYEFLGHALNIHLFTRHADNVYPPWAMVGIDELYESSELEQGYTDFRAVALPKGGEV